MSAAVDDVDVDGLRIAYRRVGTGPPLLLLHGAVSDSRVWRVELDALSDEFDVVAWDAPGCGASSDPPPTFRLPDYADALAGFVAAVGLEHPHVLGHSFGGALALSLAERHPTVPASLVLAAGYAGWAGSLPSDAVSTRLSFALSVADALPGFDPTSMPGLFSERINPDRTAELVEIMMEIRPAATRAMALGLAEADLRPGLPHVAVPTLVLAGDADERAGLGVTSALHTAIRGSTLVVLPGLGHELFLEDPSACHEAVRQFLRSV